MGTEQGSNATLNYHFPPKLKLLGNKLTMHIKLCQLCSPVLLDFVECLMIALALVLVLFCGILYTSHVLGLVFLQCFFFFLLYNI